MNNTQEAGNVPPVIVPSVDEHTSTIIFLHGLGDIGNTWKNHLIMVRPPSMKIICPTAPIRPVTLNAGLPMTSWFDLRSIDISGPEDEEGIESATGDIHKIMDEEVANGIPANRIILGGFSQGGALALYSALTYTQQLAGVVALSCWLPLHKRFPGIRKNSDEIPILQLHGSYDPVVAHKYANLSATLLKSFMKHVTFKTYMGLSHCTSDDEMDDVKAFVGRVIDPPKFNRNTGLPFRLGQCCQIS